MTNTQVQQHNFTALIKNEKRSNITMWICCNVCCCAAWETVTGKNNWLVVKSYNNTFGNSGTVLVILYLFVDAITWKSKQKCKKKKKKSRCRSKHQVCLKNDLNNTDLYLCNAFTSTLVLNVIILIINVEV